MPEELPVKPGRPLPPPVIIDVPDQSGSLQPWTAPPYSSIPGFSKQRLVLAFIIAGISDSISVFVTFMPPIQWGVDLVTAILLFMVLGWHWLLLPGLIMEAVPGVGVVPLWVLVVGAIAIWGTPRPRLNP